MSSWDRGSGHNRKSKFQSVVVTMECVSNNLTMPDGSPARVLSKWCKLCWLNLHCRNHNCFFPQKPLERNALLVKSKTLSLPQSKCPHHALLPWSLIKLLPVLPCFYYSGLKQPFLNILNPLDCFFFFCPRLKKLKFNLSQWEILLGWCLWACLCMRTEVKRAECVQRWVFSVCLVSDSERKTHLT